MKLLPDAFQFTRDGRQGKSVRLKFRPDPGYRPRSNEAKVFHSMEGILLIDASQIRLAKLSGKLMSDVSRRLTAMPFQELKNDVHMGHGSLRFGPYIML